MGVLCKLKIFLFLIVCCFVGEAFAVTRCMLTNPTSCKRTLSTDGYYDWHATCSGSGVTDMVVKGVGFCSSSNGNTRGTTAETINISETESENQYCWCKMVYPTVSSKYVFSHDTYSSGYCAYYCAAQCAYDLATYSTFRASIFQF